MSLYLQVKGLITSLVKMTKRTTRKRQLFTISELGDYIKNKIFVFVGKSRTNWTEDHYSVNVGCLFISPT